MVLPNGGSTYSNQLIISFDIPDYTTLSNIPSTIFQCSIEGQAPFDCASQTSISNLTTGTHIFQVKYNDAALPANNMVQTYSVFIWNVLGATSPPSVLSIPDEQKTPSLNPFQRTSQVLQQQESAPNNATLSTGVYSGEDFEEESTIQLCCTWGDNLQDGILTYHIDYESSLEEQDAVRDAIEEWDSEIEFLELENTPSIQMSDIRIEFQR